jgi:hypothetical protein
MNRQKQSRAHPQLQVRKAGRRQRFGVRSDPEIRIAAAAEKNLRAEASGKIGGRPHVRSVAVSCGADDQRGAQLRCSFDASRSDDGADGADPRA